LRIQQPEVRSQNEEQLLSAECLLPTAFEVSSNWRDSCPVPHSLRQDVMADMERKNT
jgi:hypothetical protein